MSEKFAVIGLIIACFIWAVSAIGYTIFIDHGLEFTLILWVILLFRVISVYFIADLKKVKHEIIKDKKELFFVILNGLFSIGTPLFFIYAITHTKFSNAYFITYTAPAWVFVAAVFLLGEKINLKKVAGLFLTLLGIYFIATPESIFSFNLGVIFSLAAAFTFAGDVITSRELKDYSYHTVSLYANVTMFVILSLLIIFVFGIPSFEHAWFYFVVLALFGISRGIAADLYYYTLENLEASTASIISLAELLFAVVLAFIVLQQFPNPTELLGYALVILSGAIIILRKSDLENFEYLLHFKRKH